MSIQDEVREFLTTRRAKVTPEEAGLPTFGGNRRVAGLRREEVALLAGVSADYYIRLERGNLRGVSEQVLDALADALRLDDAERSHLNDLARASGGSKRRTGQPTPTHVREGIQRLLNGMAGPAYVRNGRGDILAANRIAFALYDGILSPDRLPVNLPKFLFLDSRAPSFFLDWDKVADDSVAALRFYAGQHPNQKALTDLIGELVTKSDEFRTRWAKHNVKHHRTAPKRLYCSLVGELTLTGEAMELAGDGLTVIAYTAEPASKAEEAVAFLGNWANNNASHVARMGAES